MSFRTKLFLLFLVTVLASVSAVTYSVTHYTRAAYEEADMQRTQALVEQFQKEFAQQRELVARQVENVTNSEFTLKMAIDLERTNADQSLYARDAAGAAQEHGLNFMEFVMSDGTLISSAQYPARVGYKETWVTNVKDWNGTESFLRKEELPNESAVALTAVRTQPNVTRPFYAIGGRRLDRNFLASLVAPAGMRTLLYLNLDATFVPGDITAANGDVDQPERFAPIIAQIQKQPAPLVQTIQWTTDAARALARRVAHELRNPLFPLQILVEAMQGARQRGPDRFLEVFNESTATLKAELANLNSIVNRFSDFAEMPPPEFSRMHINEAIRSAVRLFEPQFHEVGKPNIATEYFLKENLPDIDGDPDLLHKAFQNLVLNALDAMPAGGTLTFRTVEIQSGIRIEVADTGKGLTPEECSRLFTPYYTTKQQG